MLSEAPRNLSSAATSRAKGYDFCHSVYCRVYTQALRHKKLLNAQCGKIPSTAGSGQLAERQRQQQQAEAV